MIGGKEGILQEHFNFSCGEFQNVQVFYYSDTALARNATAC